MSVQSTTELQGKHCKPCEGGVDKLSENAALEQVKQLDDWGLKKNATWIEKRWEFDDFQAALNFLNEVGKLAEDENHHPNLHLEDYKKVRIELSTHAIGGLSENDFILAAKIDGLS